MRLARLGLKLVRTALVPMLSLLMMLTPLGGVPIPAFADPSSPLAVTMTASPSPVASGAEITYSITSVNTGGAKVDSVVMTDQLTGVGGVGFPPQLYMTSTRGTCTQSNLKVTCSAGSIPGGGAWNVTIRGVVTAANGTTLNNTASFTGTKTAQNFTTSTTIQTLVQNSGTSPLPDLSISKTAPASVVTGGALTYTLTVNNTGNANTSNVRVVDTLPAGVGLVSASGTSLFVCTSAGTPITVTCDGGAVNQGANATITINATAPATAQSIANTAVVDPNDTILESNELNNTSSTVSTSVTSAPPPQGMTLTKTDSPDPVVPGAILTYTLVATNAATTRADNVVVVDGTQGLQASSITASEVIVNGSVGVGGGCVVTAPQVSCSIKSLNPGGTQTITIKGSVVASAGSTIFNTASVTANIKNVGVTATATALTTVMPAVDLTITKAGSPDPVCARSWPDSVTTGHLAIPAAIPAAGGTVPQLLASPVCIGGLTYSFVVGNSGIQPASNVTVRDPLPAGLIFDSYSTNGGFVCAVASNVVTCTGGAIPAQSTRNIAFLLVAPPNVGTITNVVTVDPNNAIQESDETNNTASQATTVGTGIDLVVEKDDKAGVDPPGAQPPLADGFDSIATSGTETYTITVDNVGTQDATGIAVRDTLPAGTIFLSVIADSTHGFTCSQSAGIVNCVGGHLLGTESEFYDPAGPLPPGPGDDFATIKIKIFAMPNVGTMHNEVRVDPDNTIAEVNELNNLATQDTTVVTGGASFSAFNQLTILKTQTSPVPPTAVATNGTLVYNLHVGNDGTDPVSAIVVQDFLPSGSHFIQAVDATGGTDAFFCSQAAGVVTCTGGALSGTSNVIPGVPTSRDITVTVFAPNTPGTYPNLAKVDPFNAIPEGNEFDNASQLNTLVGVGGANAFNELTIAKTQTNPAANTVATSSVVTYHLDVANAGTDPAFNVKVTDTLPAGFTYISAIDLSPISDPHSFVCASGAGNVITCTGATLSGTPNVAPGEPTSRTIEVKAFSSAVPGSYTNTAIVDPDNAIPEGNETNNTAQAQTTVTVAAGFIDLTITKTDSPDPVAPLGTITYILTAANGGTDPAFNVKVRDDLPAGTTFVSAFDTAGGSGAFSCSQAGSTVTCTGGTLDGSAVHVGVPASRTITIKVKAPNQSGITLTNQAFIDPDNAIAESNETNNSTSTTTQVTSPINLKLDKTGPREASQNTEADYVLTVTNEKADGTGAVALGVHTVDPLPVGLIPLYVTADPTNTHCQVLENPVNVVDCVGDMNPGDIVTITIHVFVTANGGPLDNEACVDPENAIAEADDSGNGDPDNCSTKTTVVVTPAPDMSVDKSAQSSVLNQGANQVYTIVASNVGNGPTTGTVTVTDEIKAGQDFVSATATNSFTCSEAAGTVTCTSDSGVVLNPGDSTTITITTTITTDKGPITNTASVSTAGDSNANNNSDTVSTSVGSTGIDLVVASVSDSPDPAPRGNSVTYTIVITNGGSADSTTSGQTVLVRDTFLAPLTGISVASATGSEGFACDTDLSDNKIECQGDLAAGHATTIKIVLGTTAGAPPILNSTVEVDPNNVITESDKTNNQATAATTISGSICSNCIDLVISDILGSPNAVTDGDTLSYTINVGNIGDKTTDIDANSATKDVLVFFDLSAAGGATFDNISYSTTSGFVCTNPVAPTGTSLLSDCKGDLAPGVGTIITISVKVHGSGTVSATSTADPLGHLTEFDETNNGPVTEITTVN